MTPLDALLAHEDVARLAGALGRHPGRVEKPAEGTRLAAIACVLRSGAHEVPELLMIKRAEVERDPWSGHIACPGGRHEPSDRDLEATAIRETWEETGVDIAKDGRVLGTLDDLHPRTSSIPAILIRPYVAVVRPDVEIVASPEVAEAFWVPLDALREQARWGRGMVKIRGEEREVSTFTHGAYTVWGLTERVLKNLMQRMDQV